MNFFYAWVGLPILFIYASYTGEINLIFQVLDIEDLTVKFNFILLLVLSGSLGITITLSTMLVVNLCSPFMLNVNGNFKNIIAAVLGFMIFDDQRPTFLVISGISVGFIGSCIYAYDELQDIRKRNQQKLENDKK